MSTDHTLLIVFLLLTILFAGTPDLIDGIVAALSCTDTK